MRAYFLNRVMGYGLTLLGAASCGDDLAAMRYSSLDGMVAEVGGEMDGKTKRSDVKLGETESDSYIYTQRSDSFTIDGLMRKNEDSTAAKDNAINLPQMPTTILLDPEEPTIPTPDLEGAIHLDGQLADDCFKGKWKDGKTYVLDKDIVLAYDPTAQDSNVVFKIIEGKDIIIDCQRHSITSSVKGKGTGFGLTEPSNVTIQNCRINDFEYGIRMWSPQETKIAYNMLNGNTEGVDVLAWNGTPSDNNYFAENLVAQGEIGIRVGLGNKNIITRNTFQMLTDYAIHFYGYDKDITLSDGNYILQNSVMGNGIKKGIVISSSTSTTLKDNSITGTTFGITLMGNIGEILVGNMVTGAKYGLFLNDPKGGAIIANNTICSSSKLDFECVMAATGIFDAAVPQTGFSAGNMFQTVDGCQKYGSANPDGSEIILWPIQSVHYQLCGKK